MYKVCRRWVRRSPPVHAKISIDAKYRTWMPDVNLRETETFYAMDGVSVLEMMILYRVHRPHAPKLHGTRRRYGFDGVYFPYVLRTFQASESRRAENHRIVVFGLANHGLNDLTFDDRVLSLMVYVL